MHKSLLILCCLCSLQLFGIVTLDRTGKKQTLSRSEDTHDLNDKQMENPHMPVMVRPTEDRGLMTRNFVGKNVKEVFTEIYKKNFWLGPDSLSGQGSSIATTVIIRTELPALWDALKVEKILDAGCGDFYWMRTIDLKQRLYVGIDVVPEMITTNRAHFGDEQHHFFCLDVTEDPLAQVDMIICRDVLAHLDYQKACHALRNFKASGSIFLLATTHLSGHKNEPVINGHHFPYDLTQAPFNLPKPLILIEETTAEQETLKQKKAMGLWLLQDLDLDCLKY